MTTDKALKRTAQARMAATGEKYTEARRAVLGDASVTALDPVRQALRPGRVVGIVSGFGLTNLGFMLPHLIRLEDAGHELTAITHERRQPDITAIPSLFDFMVARGLASPSQITTNITGDDQSDELEALVDALPPAAQSRGPLSDSDWERRMTETSSSGHAALIWVQDVQVNPPFARAGGGFFDGIETQLLNLRSLARKHNAIVAVGHCMPAEAVDSWQVISDGTDDTFVIDPSDMDHRADPATIEHHQNESLIEEFEQVIDMGFCDWRHEYGRWLSRK